MMLTKSDKIAKKSDSRLSDVLGREGISVLPKSSNIGYILCDTNHLLSPTSKDSLVDFKVHGYKDGNINLTLTMPEGLLKSYVSLLDTLQEFFRFLELKSRIAKAESKVKVIDPVEIERRQKFNDDFVKDVLEAYDGFIAQGYPVKRSISLSNLALKAKKHPWATYDLVFQTLRQNGRFKGVKLYQKKNPGGRGGVVSSETPRRDPSKR